MLKCHPITAFIKNACKFQKKIFLNRVFSFKYMFPIRFTIHILDLMLLPKNSVPFALLSSDKSVFLCFNATQVGQILISVTIIFAYAHLLN